MLNLLDNESRRHCRRVLLSCDRFPDRTILTRAWTMGSCVEQQCDVSMSILLSATRLFDINKICVAFELRLRNRCIFRLTPRHF